jgi:hypothetical protein
MSGGVDKCTLPWKDGFEWNELNEREVGDRQAEFQW